MQRLFFFAHEPADLKAPELAQAIVKELNEECSAELPPLHWQAAESRSLLL